MGISRDPFRRTPGAMRPCGRTRWFQLVLAILVERITRPWHHHRSLVLFVRTCISIRITWRRRWRASPTFVGFVHMLMLCLELTQAGSSQNIAIKVVALMMVIAHMPVAEFLRHRGYVWNTKGCELGLLVGVPLSLAVVALDWVLHHA